METRPWGQWKGAKEKSLPSLKTPVLEESQPSQSHDHSSQGPQGEGDSESKPQLLRSNPPGRQMPVFSNSGCASGQETHSTLQSENETSLSQQVPASGHTP